MSGSSDSSDPKKKPLLRTDPFQQVFTAFRPTYKGRRVRNPIFFRDLVDELLTYGSALKKAEFRFLKMLQRVDEFRGHRAIGYRSLKTCVRAAGGFRRSRADMLVAVARKCVEFPELEKALETGRLTVEKAAPILGVLTEENQTHWLALAERTPSLELKHQITTELKTRAGAVAVAPPRTRDLALESLEKDPGNSPYYPASISYRKRPPPPRG